MLPQQYRGLEPKRFKKIVLYWGKDFDTTSTAHFARSFLILRDFSTRIIASSKHFL